MSQMIYKSQSQRFSQMIIMEKSQSQVNFC